MTRSTRRVLSAVLVLFMVLALFVGIRPVTTHAASTGSNTSSNTGTRHEVCTSLSTQAENYYTGNYAWDSMSTLTGGNENCLYTDNDLFEALNTLMTTTMTKKVSYSSLTNYWTTTDCQKGGSKNIYLYSDVATSSSISREHVWPKSHASFHESGGGSDLHHLRPEDSTINSTRSSYVMGNVRDEYSSYKTKEYNGKTVLWYISTGDGLVEVADNVKGDVARILLYVWCRWEEPNLFMKTPNPVLAAGDAKNDGKKVIESLDTLLEWCAQDPVDTWEMSRNDMVQNVQGNRNVFIDYPEYAWLVFGLDVPEDVVTPANHAGTGGNGSTGGSTGGSTTTDDNYTLVTAPENGVAYKLRMDKDTPLYFNGGIYNTAQPWFLGTDADDSKACDVYAEQATGGYKLYFYNSDSEKTYICAYNDGSHISLTINEGSNSSYYDPSGTIFEYSTEYNTFLWESQGSKYFIGTSSYSSFSMSNSISYIDSGYPAHLYKQKTQDEHEHSYILSVVLPTCTTAGYDVHTCACGDDYQDNYKGALGHDWATSYTYDADNHWNACTRGCGEKNNVEAHSKVNGACNVCGSGCGHADTVSVVAVAATCTQDGMTAGTRCTVCNNIIDGCTQVKALGHRMRAATCTSPSTCTREGCGYTEGEPCGHSPLDIPARDATCIKFGLTSGSMCASCGIMLQEQNIVPKADHTYLTDTDTICTVCGYEREITTELPTEVPTDEPTEAPTDEPTEAPTDEPTETPTDEPTEAPTDEPTEAPTDEPTEAPTDEPTEAPTDAPTEAPTETPTEAGTQKPDEGESEVTTEGATETVTEGSTEVTGGFGGCGSTVGLSLVGLATAIAVGFAVSKRKE